MSKIAYIFSRHRWELVLFLGIPLIVEICTLALIYVTLVWDNVLWLVSLSVINSALPSVLLLVLLGIAYPQVRRVERNALAIVWLYTLIVAVFTLATDFLFQYDAIADRVLSSSFYWVFIWIPPLISFVMLLWFARLASRINLKYGYMLVALSPFVSNISNILIIPWQFLPSAGFMRAILDPIYNELNVAILLLRTVLGVLIASLSVRVLGDFDSFSSGQRKFWIAVLVLVGATWTGLEATNLLFDNHVYGVAVNVAWFLLYHGLAFGLIYILDLRWLTKDESRVT